MTTPSTDTDPVLVTGGTGTLGRVLVPRLRDAGHDVRVLSRTPGPGRAVGDLLTGEGLDEALAGAGTVVHCATTGRRSDIDAMRRLLDAAERSDRSGGRPHILYVSIVGIDRVGLPYYRAKLECERLLERSGLPWTVQRATQFHDLIAMFCAVQRWLPAVLMPAGVSFQPVDTRDVADRLATLVAAPPQGMAEDLGGPEVHTARALARAWLRARGSRRPVLPVRLPGAVIRDFRAGGHLTPEHATGTLTFADYLADHLTERRA